VAPTVVDLFCGAGGLGLGLAQAGYELRLAVDDFATACRTYESNLPAEEVRRADVRGLEARDLPEADVLVGGPPREPFRGRNADRRDDARERLHEDPEGSLVVQVVLHLRALAPEAFLLDLAPELAEEPLRSEVADLLERAGYEPRFHRLAADDRGVPNREERLLVSNADLEVPEADEAAPVVWEAIEDIEPLGADVANHQDYPLSPERRKRIFRLEAGESLYEWEGADGDTYTSWTRLTPWEVAPEVSANTRYVHPTQPRLLTVREHARLKGLPDDFVLADEPKHQYKVCGEVCPPELAEAAGEALRDAL
jgi:DNA (cytosine-5)-methyltransferase 1